jgi:hypothetical protein
MIANLVVYVVVKDEFWRTWPSPQARPSSLGGKLVGFET